MDPIRKRLSAVFHVYAAKVVKLDEIEALFEQRLADTLEADELGTVNDAMGGFYINNPAAAATTGQQDLYTPDEAGIVYINVGEYKQGLEKMFNIISGLDHETSGKVITALAEALKEAPDHKKSQQPGTGL